MVNSKKLTFNKKIYTLRIGVTDACTNRCRYCFIKNENRIINFSIAKKVIDFWFDAPGENKDLKIYGGEPLLCFPLVKKIVSCVFQKEKKAKKNKKVIISLITNGILLNEEHLIFLKKNNIFFNISIDGNQFSHDRFRILADGRGTFKIISRKIPLMFKILPKDMVIAAFGIHPELANKMAKNFFYLIERGFTIVSFEIIQNIFWLQSSQRLFLINLERIIKYIFSEIAKGNFIFITTINQEIKYQEWTERAQKTSGRCHFLYNFEINPEGKAFFSPLLIAHLEPRRYFVGNFSKGGIYKEYRDCQFDKNSKRCQLCWKKYYQKSLPDDYGGRVFRKFNELCIQAANSIIDLSSKNHFFKEYVEIIKKQEIPR